MPRIDGFRPVDVAPASDVEGTDAASAPAAAPTSAPAARPGATPTPGGLADRNAVMARLAAGGPSEPSEVNPASRAQELAAAGKVDMQKVEADVQTLYKAMKGVGTDEGKIFATLDGRGAEHRIAVQDVFAQKHGKDWLTLRAALKDELSKDELKRALELLDKDVPLERRGEILHDKDTSSGFMKNVRRAGVWFSFGCASKEIPNDPPRITGADLRRDLIPNLKPGDAIIVGNHGGLSHALVYVGDGKVVHSMATEETGQSVLRRLGELVKEPFDRAAVGLGWKEEKTGVIMEGLDEFFDRYERDTYVVMRDPKLTPEKAAEGVAHVKSLIGKDYDHDFRPQNDAYYCTEIVGEFFRSSLGEAAPRVGARPQKVPLLLDREAVVDPLDVFGSKDLQVAAQSKSAGILWDTDKRGLKEK